MPEGPEIRLAADRVAAAIAGKRAVEVYFGLPRLEEYAQLLTGRTVRAVEARGKAMLVTFSGNRHVYSHNQLYGRWFVRKRGRRPKTGRSLRFAVRTDTGAAFLYSASEIEVLKRREVARHPYLSKLGPDPLDEETTAEEIAARAADDRHRRRGLGGLLLDQSFVAGIGNYLRSEILFFAGLHPKRRPADLTGEELLSLGRWTVELPRRSYATRGITDEPERAAEGKEAGQPRRRYRHAVFAQAGRPCPNCGDEVARIDVAGRRLYLCPRCQPPG